MRRLETGQANAASEAAPQARRQRLGSRLMGFLRNPRPAPTSPALLPPNILYALSYRGARLHGKDVESLHASGFPRAAFYLALKSAEDSDGVQKGLLQRLADLNFDYANLAIDDIRPATRRMDERRTQVGGEKLRQYSRHGLAEGVVRFDETLGAAYAGRPRAPLFMVANYPFVALDVLAEHSLEAGQTLGIIKPERLGQTALSVGFMLEPGQNGTRVQELGHDFRRPEGAVIFDDVLRTGHVRDQVLDFWGGEAPPNFVTGVRVASTI